MLNTLKQLTSKENKDIRKRIYFTLFVLLIFVVGTNIRVPGTKDYTSSLGFLELLNVMGGGALKRQSIFALGVMPYITAQIIMELLQMDIIPYFSELKKEGPVGRQKINQISRYAGIFIAFIQGFGLAYMFMGKGKPVGDYLYISTILTAGTAFLLWLGDQVTEKGIGNGLSLLIMAGIVINLPSMMMQAFELLVLGTRFSKTTGSILFALFIAVYFLIILGVIFVEQAIRKVPIQYATKTTFSKSNRSYMPFKINSAGVIPVIFASSLMMVPSTLAQFTKNAKFIQIANNYFNYTKTVGFIIFVVLIFAFSYFYTFVQIRPDELAKNLNEAGGFIPGIRPGKETQDYISALLTRITLFGSIFIAMISGFPIIFNNLTKLPSTITLGGTGLLIVVGVVLETYKQLESGLVARHYTRSYLK